MMTVCSTATAFGVGGVGTLQVTALAKYQKASWPAFFGQRFEWPKGKGARKEESGVRGKGRSGEGRPTSNLVNMRAAQRAFD